MLLERHDLGAPAALVAEIRALAPQAPSVAAAVSEIIAAVAAEGDAAVRRYTARFDADPPPPARVEADELAHALAVLDPAVRAGLEVAIANVAEVAWAAADDDREVTLAQGQRVLLREMPVARAAVYVPGGRAPYPSTVVMGTVTARAARSAISRVSAATAATRSPAKRARSDTRIGQSHRRRPKRRSSWVPDRPSGAR